MTELLSWVDALSAIRKHKGFILSVDLVWQDPSDVVKSIDLEHLWCVKSNRAKALDFVFHSLGWGTHYLVKF